MTDNDQPASAAPEPSTDSPKPPKPVDWEARFKENQAYNTKLAMANADLRKRLEAYESDEADDDEAGVQAPISRFRPRIPEPERPAVAVYDAEGAELGRSIAEQVHGADALADYDRVEQLLQEARTVSDKVAALEAYRDLRARSAQSTVQRRTPSAEAVPSRDQAVTPRVETNRPDGPMGPDEPSTDRYLGGANGGVGGYVRELLAFRRGPR